MVDPDDPNGYEAGEIVASARAKIRILRLVARAHYDDEVAYITGTWCESGSDGRA